ncbi:hypothetical protein BgiMline_013381 [Biomphalaria glabrata]|nr:hypothetical protein BgiMline_017189 [Biomphalaria glabrata]
MKIYFFPTTYSRTKRVISQISQIQADDCPRSELYGCKACRAHLSLFFSSTLCVSEPFIDRVMDRSMEEAVDGDRNKQYHTWWQWMKRWRTDGGGGVSSRLGEGSVSDPVGELLEVLIKHYKSKQKNFLFNLFSVFSKRKCLQSLMTKTFGIRLFRTCDRPSTCWTVKYDIKMFR